MLKNIFNPICNLIINIAAYLLLGMVLWFELNEIGFFTAGIIISVLLVLLYALYLNRYQTTTKAQHLVFVVITLSVLLLMLIHYAVEIKRSGFALLIISLASLSPFYNFCGYARYTQVDESTSLLKYVLSIMLVPFTAFLIYNHYAGTNYKTIYVIVIVAAYYFVIFSLVKIAVLAIKEKNLIETFFTTPKAQYLITLFLAIVMPLTGLLLNQFMYSYVSQYAKQTGYVYFQHINDGFFGNFSHPFFYLLTIVNGLSLLAHVNKYPRLRLPLFYLRSLCYCFIVYMFVVFLPVLPVGVLGLFFIVGIYAFVPLLIAWWQGKILLADYKLLITRYNKKWVVSIFILGFLTLPAIMASFFVYDKDNFNKAIVYTDPNNDDASEKIDISALERTLNSLNASTYRRQLYRFPIRTYYSYGNIPIISSLYKLTILGGQSLDWQYHQKLNALFLNSYYYSYNENETNLDILDYYNRDKSPILVSDISHNTQYDESIQAYRTWIDIELKNGESYKNEYKTVFYIPDGVYVSDYYLYVGDEKKMGLLTDRRAALSIYKSIVLRQLDPGVLHYVNENLLELRVFPFSPRELRKTGFELIHKNKFELLIGGHEVKIAVGDNASEIILPNAVLLSYAEIEKLPRLNKDFDYNFILDCSEESDVGELKQLIKDYSGLHGIKEGSLYLTTYRFDKYPLKDLDKVKVKKEGGFNLNLAVMEILRNTDDERIPVIIFATDKDVSSIIGPKNINYALSPDTDFYYELNSNLSLTPYSIFTNYKLDPVSKPVTKSIVSYNGTAVINDGNDKLVVLDETRQELTNNQYLDAVALAVENKVNMKNGTKNTLSYIKKSFLSRVLTPSTAFIVVETKEQEEDLLKLQEKILSEQELKESDKPNLSEPHIGFIAALVCLCLLVKKAVAFAKGFIFKPAIEK